ncbi:MAG: nucleotidyltransferase family protein [Oscillospiraceae bacterium]|nr:nucleotidyltransferase family protein [Oscillospiraceae bacterium]
MSQENLNKNFFDIVYLLYCSLNAKKADKSRVDKMNLDEIYRLAVKHNITAAVAHSIVEAGVEEERWSNEINNSLYRIILFDAEREQLINYLEENGIWYVLLKGLVLMNYYPQVYMRQMSDNDILFDSKYQAKIREYFESHGYTTKGYGKIHHDTYQKKPVLNFEMHLKLYSEESPRCLYEYYSDVKRILVKDTDNSFGYHFSDEDFYVHTVSHAYKHYMGSGFGLKLLLDVYVCLKKFGKAYDYNYISDECKKAGFDDYEKLCRSVSLKLFSSEQPQELSDDEMEFVLYSLSSGTYGTFENRVRNHMKQISDDKQITKKTKFTHILKRAFPKPDYIYTMYPVVRKYKILLPFAYPYRLIYSIVFKRKRVVSEFKYIKEIKE